MLPPSSTAKDTDRLLIVPFPDSALLLPHSRWGLLLPSIPRLQTRRRLPCPPAAAFGSCHRADTRTEPGHCHGSRQRDDGAVGQHPSASLPLAYPSTSGPGRWSTPSPPLTDAETEAREEAGPAKVTQERTITRMHISGFLTQTANARVIIYPTKQNILGPSIPP